MREFGYAKCVKECDTFVCTQMAVRVRSESYETDVHDARTLQIAHGVAECGAHTLHLMVLAFGEYNAKCVCVQSFHDTRLGRVVADIDTVRHELGDVGAQALVHPHAVFFFVVPVRREKWFDDPSVVRKENESVTVLVEPPHRKHVDVRVSLLQVVQYFLLTLLRSMRHRTARFVVGEVDESLARCMEEHAHVVAFSHLVSKHRGYTIEEYLTGRDEFVGLFSSRIAMLCQVAVDAYGGGALWCSIPCARSAATRRCLCPMVRTGGPYRVFMCFRYWVTHLPIIKQITKKAIPWSTPVHRLENAASSTLFCRKTTRGVYLGSFVSRKRRVISSQAPEVRIPHICTRVV